MSILVNQSLNAARQKAYYDNARGEMLDVLMQRLKEAQKKGDEVLAADTARLVRNKLLDMSDKEVTLDRSNPDISSSIAFFSSLKNIICGEWAVYRQALRDITELEGFPLNFEFPLSPDQNKIQE